jgi:Fur family ferric uptake transcriptional regulator
VAPALDPDEVALRAAGLRITVPRRAVLAWLATHPHATVEEIGVGVRGEHDGLSAQAVYDMLAAFTGAGLVRRIEPARHPARYERRVGDNHHHLVCRHCDATVDVDCVLGAPACLTPTDHHGFAVDEAEIVFWGLCPACQQLTQHQEDRR